MAAVAQGIIASTWPAWSCPLYANRYGKRAYTGGTIVALLAHGWELKTTVSDEFLEDQGLEAAYTILAEMWRRSYPFPDREEVAG